MRYSTPSLSYNRPGLSCDRSSRRDGDIPGFLIHDRMEMSQNAASNQRPRRRGRPQTNSRSLANLIPHRYKPGESGNRGGRTDQYLEAQRICREATPAAARKMVALMDSADERVALMAADKVFERAWGKAPEYNPDQEAEPLNYLKARAALESEPLTQRELDAIAELASARLAAIEARAGPQESGADSDEPV
jgi:hypothetical protein